MFHHGAAPRRVLSLSFVCYLPPMATLIPALGSCLKRMTPGERRFAERLEQKLEEDYLCWFDVPIGPANMHPDFVVLHPRRGLIILEVKDWKLDTIIDADRLQVAR